MKYIFQTTLVLVASLSLPAQAASSWVKGKVTCSGVTTEGAHISVEFCYLKQLSRNPVDYSKRACAGIDGSVKATFGAPPSDGSGYLPKQLLVGADVVQLKVVNDGLEPQTEIEFAKNPALSAWNYLRSTDARTGKRHMSTSFICDIQ